MRVKMNLLGYSDGVCGLSVEDPREADQRHFRYLCWLVEDDEADAMYTASDVNGYAFDDAAPASPVGGAGAAGDAGA
jgi:hypothetical protein